MLDPELTDKGTSDNRKEETKTGSKGKQAYILDGNIWAGMVRLAFPLAATGILQQLFNAADIAVVGRFVGTEAMAALGNDTPVISVVINLFVGIALGTNVVIAQAIGRGDRESAKRTANSSILLALTVGIVLAVVSQFLVTPVLNLMSVPDSVFEMAASYLHIYFAGFPVFFLYNFQAAIFRSRGDTKTPLIVLLGAGALNVGLNILFVAGFGMDVDGVALATVISELISVVILWIILVRGPEITAIKLKYMRFCPELKVVLKIGVPAGVQNMVFALANICIQTGINSLGENVMAGSSAAYNIEILAHYFITSFGQATTTFAGQNYGAGKAKRCRKILIVGLVENFAFTTLAIVLIISFGRPLLSVFNSDAEVIEYGYIRLVYIFISYFFSLVIETFSGFLRGFGISNGPAIASLFGVCGIRLIWLYTIFYRYPSFEVLMTAYPVSMFITSVVNIIMWLVEKPVKRKMKVPEEMQTV